MDPEAIFGIDMGFYITIRPLLKSFYDMKFYIRIWPPLKSYEVLGPPWLGEADVAERMLRTMRRSGLVPSTLRGARSWGWHGGGLR